jgi:hypothetical protein
MVSDSFQMVSSFYGLIGRFFMARFEQPHYWTQFSCAFQQPFNEELHNLYSSPDIIRQVKSRRMRWAGHVARMGEERKVYTVLVGKPEGRRLLGRPRRRWEDGIRMDIREIGLGGGVCGLDSTGSGQGPVAGCF